MNVKKILSIMTLATLLNTGVVAHAAPGTFNNNSNGTQSTIVEDKNITGTPSVDLNAEGDIQINGEFRKTVTNMPKPDKDGRYLRVTMPIKMDFIYDVDTHIMTSAESTIINESVLVTDTATSQKVENQPIKMEYVGVQETVNGSTIGVGVKFVDSVNSTNKADVQLPFEMSLIKQGIVIRTDKLIDIQQTSSKDLNIQAGERIQLKLGLIPGQIIGNADLINKDISTVKHDLQMKFEYAGK